MRVLLPLLLLAGAVAGFLVLRTGPEVTPGATGPGSTPPATSDARPPVDLARGATPDGRVSAAAAPGAATGTPAAVAPVAEAAPESVNAGLGKEPAFEGNATSAPVGDAAPAADASLYAAKYRGTSTAERAAALESLRIAFESETTSGAKNAAELMAEMKREMEWLQANPDG